MVGTGAEDAGPRFIVENKTIAILYEQIVTEIRFSENRNDSPFVVCEHQRMLMSTLIIRNLYLGTLSVSQIILNVKNWF